MEVHGGVWKLVDCFRRILSWKLQLMAAMEASSYTVSENFYLLPWELPLISMEVNIHPFTSMEVNILPT